LIELFGGEAGQEAGQVALGGDVLGEGDAQAGEVLDLLEGDVAVLADGELVLEVLDDEHGAPAGALLALHDVAVDVVADVEDLVGVHAEGGLQALLVAAEVDAAALGLGDGLAERAVGEVELLERRVAGEEARLARADDDPVEVVAPVAVGGELAAEHVAHDVVGVGEQAVGQQEQLLAGAAELVERRAELGVDLEVAAEVGLDEVLERAVLVGLVDALAHVGPRLRVGRRAAAPHSSGRWSMQSTTSAKSVTSGSANRVSTGAKRSRSVPRRWARYRALRSGSRQQVLAVVGAPDVAVAVHLDDVAELLVDDEAADREVGSDLMSRSASG
jgi:hypothetical protein